MRKMSDPVLVDTITNRYAVTYKSERLGKCMLWYSSMDEVLKGIEDMKYDDRIVNAFVILPSHIYEMTIEEALQYEKMRGL